MANHLRAHQSAREKYHSLVWHKQITNIAYFNGCSPHRRRVIHPKRLCYQTILPLLDNYFFNLLLDDTRPGIAKSLVFTHPQLPSRMPSLVFRIVAVETDYNHKDGGRLCGKLRSFAG